MAQLHPPQAGHSFLQVLPKVQNILHGPFPLGLRVCGIKKHRQKDSFSNTFSIFITSRLINLEIIVHNNNNVGSLSNPRLYLFCAIVCYTKRW